MSVNSFIFENGFLGMFYCTLTHRRNEVWRF